MVRCGMTRFLEIIIIYTTKRGYMSAHVCLSFLWSALELLQKRQTFGFIMSSYFHKWTPPRNSGEVPSVSTRFSLSMEMSRLTRDGTAEPVSRDQILRHARGQGNIIFPVQLTTSRIDNLARLIHTLLYVMTIHTYIRTYILEAFVN